MKKILIFMIVFIFGNIFPVNIFANTKTETIQHSTNLTETRTTTIKPCSNCGNVSTSGNGTSKTSSPSSGGGGGGLESSSYMFPTSDFVPGGSFSSGGTKERLDKGFVTTIQRLMIPFGVLATIIMTIGAGYMVLHNGDDEMLNKGKKIFKMGIFATAIALSSYLIVELLKNVLYA